MKDSMKLTQLELVLLELVDKGEGKWSWYELANALSRRDVPREPDMMEVLKKLAADGLVKRYAQPGSPRDRWELTPEGTILLREAKQSDRLTRKPAMTGLPERGGSTAHEDMLAEADANLPLAQLTRKQLQQWARAQIDNTAQPEVQPEIAIGVLQLIDEVEQLQKRVKELE